VNYYKARELADRDGHSGGFHFTCRNDDRVWPVGACRDHPPHPTAEDAERCFYDHELAQPVVRALLADQMLRCGVCNEFTAQTIRAGMHLFDSTVVCETCVPLGDDDEARRVLADLHPFTTGILIVSSW